MLNKKLIFIMLLAWPYATYALFCPSNFNVINIGDSIDSVKQLCGKPDKEKTKEEPEPEPQEWTYYIPQPVLPGTPSQAAGQAAGTLKTTFSFDKESKVVSITANGLGVGSTPICGTPVQLGNTRQEVKTACGEPSFVKKSEGDKQGSDKISITEYTYHSNPPVTLIFTSGKLSGTK